MMMSKTKGVYLSESVSFALRTLGAEEAGRALKACLDLCNGDETAGENLDGAELLVYKLFHSDMEERMKREASANEKRADAIRKRWVEAGKGVDG